MRFYLIDALRGIAAMWVVLFHAHAGGHIDALYKLLPPWLAHLIFDLGDGGVPMFFVISGFVIAHSVAQDRVTGGYLARFTVRRSIRLDPPYWGAMLLMVFMAWLSAQVKGGGFQGPDTATVVAHIFYAQGILEIPHINVIFWTLCLEIQFYLIFCLLIFLIQRLEPITDKAFLAVMGLVAAISLLWPLGIVRENLYPGLFLPFWHAFLSGCFAYFSWKKRIPKRFFYLYTLTLLPAAIINGSVFSLIAVLTSLLVHELAQFGWISILNWRPLQFLGKISYSLYLTHNPITGAVFFLLYKGLGHSTAAQFVAFIANILVCVGFAYLFWWLFERWSMRLSKKIRLQQNSRVMTAQTTGSSRSALTPETCAAFNARSSQ